MTAGDDICPYCGDERAAQRERCPGCGRVRPPAARGKRPGAKWVALVAGILISALLAAVIVSERRRADHEDERARARVAELRREVERLQAPHRASAEYLQPPAGANRATVLAARAQFVRRAESTILADARRRIRSGELDRPVRDVRCGPLSGDANTPGDDRDLRAPIGRYSCTARITDVVDGSGESVASYGYAYVAALDFTTFKFVYCRNTPAQGERGVALVRVRLDRACLAARGKPVGSGYASVPDPPLPLPPK